MFKKKKWLIGTLLFICTLAYGQSRPPLEVTRAIFPDLTVFGYSTYLTTQGAIGLRNHNFDEFNGLALSSGILMMASSGLHMTNNLFISDPDKYKTLLWISRAGYIATFASSILYGIFEPGFEGTERLGIGISISIPSLIGFGLTFLPYPGGDPKTK